MTLPRLSTLPATTNVMSCDVAVIGGGPAGAVAAIYAARAGLDVIVVDQAEFPRDKTCGDGLTPRAVAKLRELDLLDEMNANYRNRGLKLHGFGGSVTAQWPDGTFGQLGAACPRWKFDDYLLRHAALAGAQVITAARAEPATLSHNRLESVVVTASDHTDKDEAVRTVEIRPRWTIVADGVRSTFGKKLGRVWHRDEVYGIAARSYCTSPFSNEPWMHSHLELTDADDAVKPGYGWIFPLGDGTVNLGCGALSTQQRPAKINTKKLLELYASRQRQSWQLGPAQQIASALLPMGGAVSNVAGANWMLIGDAAGCVNPLNGEGIDYGFETAELAVELLTTGAGSRAARERDLTLVWPQVLRSHFGQAFVLARTAARLLTYPQFLPVLGPLGLRGPAARLLMPAAARLMGNLVTDGDADLVARLWRKAGATITWARRDSPLWDSTVAI